MPDPIDLQTVEQERLNDEVARLRTELADERVENDKLTARIDALQDDKKRLLVLLRTIELRVGFAAAMSPEIIAELRRELLADVRQEADDR